MMLDDEIFKNIVPESEMKQRCLPQPFLSVIVPEVLCSLVGQEKKYMI